MLSRSVYPNYDAQEMPKSSCVFCIILALRVCVCVWSVLGLTTFTLNKIHDKKLKLRFLVPELWPLESISKQTISIWFYIGFTEVTG